MRKDELRKCKYKSKDIEKQLIVENDELKEIVEKEEWKNGLFHKWFVKNDYYDSHQVSSMNALIETEQGDVILLDIEYYHVQFLD
ncbi:hypothetical protein [Clostridium cochlearium]|uniref:hypothetical protein n=1 Tax=Clostridium cochlearium TaxID=1494 RepID=UPI000BBBBD62|nr:hypothetical protein [Clostridium cochlearium]